MAFSLLLYFQILISAYHALKTLFIIHTPYRDSALYSTNTKGYVLCIPE